MPTLAYRGAGARRPNQGNGSEVNPLGMHMRRMEHIVKKIIGTFPAQFLLFSMFLCMFNMYRRVIVQRVLQHHFYFCCLTHIA